MWTTDDVGVVAPQVLLAENISWMSVPMLTIAKKVLSLMHH
jgi:hypothetical protein